jgi:type VI secretion system protein ImpB
MSTKNEALNARINITVDVDKNGAKEKVELPFNLLVVDDFSPGSKKKPLIEQEKLLVTKKNINEIIKEISPELNLIVENKLDNKDSELKVNLQFNKIEDFRPENLVQKVPVLKKILAMRSLLKELRVNVTNSSEFRKTLEKLINHPGGLDDLRKQIPEIIQEEKNELV